MTTTLRPPSTTTPPKPKTPGYRRPWIVPLLLIAGAFLGVSVPRYLTFDPANAAIDMPKDFPPYYGFLVAHVLFAAVAMAACCMQIWPWLRQRHPALHRATGRIYVFGGVLPAGVAALGLAWGSAFGPVASVSTFMMAPLWMAITIAGFRMARQRRFGDHRRWMVRSFTLTMSIIANRVLGVFFFIGYSANKETLFDGNMTWLSQAVGGTTSWVGWVACLLIAEWWLIERGGANRRRVRHP